MKIPEKISQSFSVSYEYKLHFTEDLFNLNNLLFANILDTYKNHGLKKTLFLVDEGVYRAHPNLLNEIKVYCSQFNSKIKLMEILLFTGGENEKNKKESLKKVRSAINNFGICKHSFVIAIGGGALIDMGGYAAATAHRGVKIIRIPTTVLSQNDAAVGVKNGINEFNKKNFLGTFSPPFAIINDFNFLKTLDQRDWISGIAEAIKVALIKDSSFFDFIEKNSNSLAIRKDEEMKYLIYKCAEMHMNHIANEGDPFESGSSRPLDFGHWSAHKLEQITNYNIRHGEAVAIGIALDTTYSHLIGLIDKKALNQILNVLKKIGFNIKIPTHINIEELLEGIQEFKEHLGGELSITLISEIGTKIDVNYIDMKKMREAIKLLSL